MRIAASAAFRRPGGLSRHRPCPRSYPICPKVLEIPAGRLHQTTPPRRPDRTPRTATLIVDARYAHLLEAALARPGHVVQALPRLPTVGGPREPREVGGPFARRAPGPDRHVVEVHRTVGLEAVRGDDRELAPPRRQQLGGPADTVGDPAVEGDAVAGVSVGGVREGVGPPDGATTTDHALGPLAERVAEREPDASVRLPHRPQVRARDPHRGGVVVRARPCQLAQLRDAAQAGEHEGRAGGRGAERAAGSRRRARTGGGGGKGTGACQEPGGQRRHDIPAHRIDLSLLVGHVAICGSRTSVQGAVPDGLRGLPTLGSEGGTHYSTGCQGLEFVHGTHVRRTGALTDAL